MSLREGLTGPEAGNSDSLPELRNTRRRPARMLSCPPAWCLASHVCRMAVSCTYARAHIDPPPFPLLHTQRERGAIAPQRWSVAHAGVCTPATHPVKAARVHPQHTRSTAPCPSPPPSAIMMKSLCGGGGPAAMQWPSSGRNGAGGMRPSLSVLGRARVRCVAVEAKLKYKANIVQNHSSKSDWASVDLNRLYTDKAYTPARSYGPLQLKEVPGGCGCIDGACLSSRAMAAEPMGVHACMHAGCAARACHACACMQAPVPCAARAGGCALHAARAAAACCCCRPC